MPTITSVATAVPDFSATQDEVKRAFRPLFPLDERRLNAAMAFFDNAEVERRHSVLALDDIGRKRTLTDTMDLYAASAKTLGTRVARECLRRAGVAPSEVDIVVSVSCTGVMIPSLDAYLMDALGMRSDVRRLPITELGCVGGAAALARSYDLLRGMPEARVLVVSVELPSLSLQRLDVSPSNLVSSAIFGDGAAAVLMEGDRVGRRHMHAGAGRAGGARVVSVLEALSDTAPASQHHLGFDLHDDGFHPVLSREVPSLLRSTLRAATEKLCAKAGRDISDIRAFVVHAGGKKILGAVEEALGLRREDTQRSWDVLREYGNQSSASVLFVLERWVEGDVGQPPPGTLGLLSAFGPGLTTELLLLQWN